MSTRQISGSSDVDAASRSASRCQNVEELEDELQTTKTMLDQLRVVMRKREEDTSRSKQEAEDIITKLTKVKLCQKARVQSLKSRLHELEPGKDSGEKSRLSANVSLDEDDATAADVRDDESVISDISMSELSDVSRMSASGAVLTRQFSENRDKCVAKLRVEKRKLEELSKRMEETIRQKNQEFEELQKPTFSDPLPDSDKLAGSVRQIILLEKEINSLKAKIADQSNKIFNLEETLREKDKIIEARTQAVALMSENLTKKNKETAAKLEDTRNEMVSMQENFIAKQDSWNAEREQILQDLDQQTERAAQMSYQLQSLETIRFDLSLRNAELQEKVVRLQDDTEDRIRRVERDYQEDLEELEDSLTKARNQLKIQGKAKDKEISSLKSLAEALESQLQESAGINDERYRLLEEENAMLKAKVASQKDTIAAVEATDDAEEWKRRLLMANDDLDRHVKSLAVLEKEKLDLMEELSDRDKTINKLKRKLAKSIPKSKKSEKAEAVKDADDSNAQASDAEDGAGATEDGSPAKEEDREKIIASLMEEVEELRTRASDMEVINFGGMTDMVNELSSRDTKISTLQSQLVDAKSKIGELEVEILEKAELLEDMTQQLSLKSSGLEASEARVIKLTKDLENLQIQHADHVAEVAVLSDSLMLRNSELDDAKAELQRLKESLEAEASAESRLRELESVLESVEAEKSAGDDALARTRAELTARNTAFEELATEHERKLGELMSRITNEDDVIRVKRATELENEIESLRGELEEARAEIDAKSSELEELTEFATEKEQMTAARVEELKAEVDRLEKALAESSEELTRKEESLSDLASLLEETRAAVVKREEQIRELEDRVAKLEASRAGTHQEASSGTDAEPSSVGEEDFLQSVVQASLEATENVALHERAEKSSRTITDLTSERNQLQDDVITMAGDASMMLADQAKSVVENTALIDELYELRKKWKKASLEIAAMKAENEALKEVRASSGRDAEPSSVGEADFLQSVVQASLDATENVALHENAEKSSRRITELTSQRNQLQVDVVTMTGDASIMLADQAKSSGENTALIDELDGVRKKWEEALVEMSELKTENQALKESSTASEREIEALKCELEELTTRLDTALESLSSVRAELDTAHEEKSKILEERNREADLADKRITELLADFEEHAKREGVPLAQSMPQHVPDALQSRLESIFRKFCIFVRSVAGVCDNVCKEKGRGSQSGDDDNWGDWEESASDSEPYETPWWKQYVDEPEKFLHLPNFWEKLRVFADFVETVLYDELETLQMNRDELKQELELHTSETPKMREDTELAGLRIERDSLVARLDAVTDDMMDYRDKCNEKEATVQSLMEEKQELEQKYDRLMVKTQNKEAKISADQQALMRLGANPVTVQDLQRALHRLSCELFPRFVAGDEPESEAVLGGATSCPEFGSEGVETSQNLTVEDAVKQALLEIRSRCFQARSEDGEDGNVDVLDELRDRCVALKEALETAQSDLDTKVKKLDEMRTENGRLAQSNREIRAAAQQLTIQVGSISDDISALSRTASGELTAYWDDLEDVCSALKSKVTAALKHAEARAEIEEQYKNEILMIKEQLEDEKEENEHLNEKIASLEKCVFSEHLENQVSEQDREIERLQDQVKAVQAELDAARDTLTGMEREKMALQDERNSLLAQIRSSSVVSEPLVQSAEGKDKELETLKTEYNALKTKYTKALARLKQLKTAGVAVPASPAQASASEAKVDESSVKLQALLTENAASKEKFAKLSEELETAKSAAASSDEWTQRSSKEIDALKIQLDAAMDELHSKSSAMESMMDERTSLEQRLQSLQTENASLNEKLRKIEEELESTKLAADSFEDWGQDSSQEVDSLKSELKAAKEELQSTLSERESLVAERSSVEQNLHTLKEENASLKDTVNKIEKELESAKSAAATFEDWGEDSSQEVDSLKSQLDAAREELRLKTAEIASMVAEKSFFDEKFQNTAAVVENQELRLTELQSELQGTKQELDSLRQHASKYVELESEARRLFEENDHLRTDIRQMNEDLDAKAAAVYDLQTQLQSSESRKASLESQLEEKRVQLQSMAESDDVSVQELAELREKQAILEDERGDLEVRFTQSTQRVCLLEGEISQMEEKLSSVEDELHLCKEAIAAKESLIQELSDDKSRLTEDLQHVKERLSDLRGILELKEEEMDELGMQLESLRATADEKAQEVQRLAGVEEQHKTVIDSLKSALDMLTEKTEAGEENVRTLEQRLAEAERKHEETVREAEQQIHSLTEELTEKRTLVESLRDQLINSAQSSEEVADLQRRIKETDTLLMMNEEERNEADALFAKVSEELNVSQAVNAELTQKIASLESELSSSKVALETDKMSMDSKVEEFVRQMEEKEASRRAAEEEKAKLEEEVEGLRRIQEQLEAEQARERDEMNTRFSELEQGKELELQSQRENFLSEISSLRETLSSLTQERDELLSNLRDAKEKILVLEDAREEVLVTDEKLTLEATIRDLESRLSGVTEERNSILAAKTNAEATIVSLTSEIDSLQASAADRAKEWETLTADLDERIAENLSYAHEIKSLQEEVEQLRQKQVAVPVAGNVELEAELKRLKAANEQLTRSNAELTEQCSGLAGEVETLQGWLGRFKDSNVDHQSKEKDLAVENQDLLRRLAELENRQHDFSDWRMEKERLETSYEELKSAHDSVFSDYSDLQNRYEELKFEYNLAVSEKDRMKAERVNDDEIKEMKMALIDKEVTISDLESRLETETQAQHEEIEELKHQMERMGQALVAHEQKWGNRDQESEELVRSMGQVQAQLDAQLVDLQEKDQVIASLENHIRQLEASKQEVEVSLSKEKAVLEQELANVKVHHEGLQQTPASGDGRNLRQLEEELEQQLRKGFSSKEAEFRYHKVCLELEEARKEISVLRKKASDAETALQAAVGNNGGDVQNAYRIIQAEAQLATATAERDQLREKEKELREQLSLLRRRNELLLNEMSDQWDQTVEEERQKAAGVMPEEAVKMELDNTIAALHSRDVRCEELAFEVTSLTEERDSLQIQLSSALKRELELRKELKKEMQTLTSTLASGTDVASSSPETELHGEAPDKEVVRRIGELQKLNYNLDVQLATEREARKRLADKLERRRRRLGRSAAVPPRMSPPVTPDPSSVVEEKDVTITRERLGTPYGLGVFGFGFGSPVKHV